MYGQEQDVESFLFTVVDMVILRIVTRFFRERSEDVRETCSSYLGLSFWGIPFGACLFELISSGHRS